MVVMQGAHNYSDVNHPFNIALQYGKHALSKFYDGFSPKNIIEMYHLDSRGLLGEDLPPWELPWLFRKRQHPPGEGGLGPEHGVSFFGPCTSEKVDLELRRLVTTVQSISKNGYQPTEHGHIEGYFLQRDNEYRFFILGGKHRAASLCNLGHTNIPVRMRTNCPRLISRKDSAAWPLVQNGEMDQKLAEAIFDSYFAK